MAKCKHCWADIKWVQNLVGKWIPMNLEDMSDDCDPDINQSHFRTCKPQETRQVPLSHEQRTRPGYL